MFLGKTYYNPKHPAGFGSVAKLVKASKTKTKRCGIVAVRSDHLHFAKTCSKQIPAQSVYCNKYEG